MKQAVVTPTKRLRLPQRMLRAYKHSTNEYRALLNAAYRRLTDLGLSLYPTDCPDLRAKHPQNDLVFVVLAFQEVAGTRIEVRVDSCPRSFWANSSIRPKRVTQNDRNSRARWAVYPIVGRENLGAAMSVITRIMEIRPAWGNFAAQQTAEGIGNGYQGIRSG